MIIQMNREDPAEQSVLIYGQRKKITTLRCQIESGDQRPQTEKGVAETCTVKQQMSKVDVFQMDENYHLERQE